MKYIPWLAFGCSLALLLLASSTAYRMEFWVCRGLPFVYEMKISRHVYTLLAVPGVFRPLALAADITVAVLIAGFIGLFVSRFGRMQQGTRLMFLLAILLFAAAEVTFLFVWSGPKGMTGSSYRLINDWAPYYFYLTLVPSVALTVSGLVWSLVSERRRRSQPLPVTQ